MSTPVLLTPRQAADRLLVSAWTIRDWARRGKITAVRLGAKRGPVRIPESEIARLIATHTQHALGQAPPKPLAAASARLRAARRAG